MAGARGFVAVVGARVVPESVAPQVAAVVRAFLARGWGIGSGGARGADAFALCQRAPKCPQLRASKIPQPRFTPWPRRGGRGRP